MTLPVVLVIDDELQMRRLLRAALKPSTVVVDVRRAQLAAQR